MLAAAMRAFVLASEKDQNDWYFDAYRSLPKAVIGEDEKNEADRPDHGSFGQALDKAHSKLEKAAAARTRKPAKDR